MRRRSGWAALFIVAALAVVPAPAGAVAATVVNGGFESGNLDGWQVYRATGLGNWYPYSGTTPPISSSKRTTPTFVQAPPQGTYAAITDEANPDTLILYQDVALEPGIAQQLSLLAYYNSYDPLAVPTPDTLSVDEGALGGQANQQFRIDVMKPEAPIESLDPADILRTVFATRPGGPRTMAPTRLTANLAPFAGQTVRLRIANVVQEEVFNAGVDAISIVPSSSSAGAGQSPSRGSKQGPKLFSLGKLRLRRDGTATLRVRVSGPGLLRASAASSSRARASRAKELRRPIEPLTISIGKARTVTLHLRLTPAARMALRRSGRLHVGVDVTYRPTDGPAEATSLPVVFELAVRSK